MVPNPRFGSWSWFEPNRNCRNRFHSIKNPKHTGPAVLWLVSPLRELRTSAQMKFLSSDHTAIWYICKRCSFEGSFISCSPICDPINSHWVTAKNAQFSALFHSNSTNIDWITHWKTGGERASKTASCTYISYCDTIRTQILNWRESSEFAEIRLCCM